MEPQRRPSSPPAMDTDALPMPAADSYSHSHSQRPPAPRIQPPPSRHQRGQNALLMELLSRRMSRQTLLQQSQACAAQQRRHPRSHSSHSQPPPLLAAENGPSDDKLLGRGDTAMAVELDLDAGLDTADLPSLAAYSTASEWTTRRNLPPTAPTPSEPSIDPSATARVLQRLQSNARPGSDPNAPSALEPDDALPAIEIDPAVKPGMDLEVDEGYGEAADDFSWLEDQGPGFPGDLQSQGVLRFTSSSEAALRCPKLVRNVPRMRKRKQKKREHRLRAATANNNNDGGGGGSGGESSLVATDTRLAASDRESSTGNSFAY